MNEHDFQDVFTINSNFLYHYLQTQIAESKKQKSMTSQIPSTTYIKKLIRIIYDKEKQIEQLKKAQKQTSPQSRRSQKHGNVIDSQIKNDISITSTQLKEVTMQMTAMETKMMDLTNGLEEEINKNQKYQHEIESIKNDNNLLLNQNEELKQQICKLLKDYEKLTSLVNLAKEQNKDLNKQLDQQTKELSSLQLKLLINEEKLFITNESLKDYQEFAYEIGQYIDSTFHKQCQPTLKSSKKIIKPENKQHRFQEAFKKISAINNYIEDLRGKLERLGEDQEVVDVTVEGLSIIVKSFERKLDVCQTDRQENQDELDLNEDLLLENLQKQCQASVIRDRTKMVQLDEIKQVLKMTKDVNRQLMDQINHQEYIIGQCKTNFQGILGSKNKNQKHQHLAQLLGLSK